MKRIWLGTAMSVLLLSSVAHGQVIVSDPLTETNTLQSLIREAVAAEKRVEMINNQIIQIQNLINTVNAVAHGNVAALASLSPELGALGLTSPLGNDTLALVQSFSGLAGSVGVTGELAQQMLSTDRYYAPSGADFRAIALNQVSAALAQQKALAQLALDSNTRRLASLTTLRNQLGSTADVKAAADATARLTGEQATAQAQTNQLLAAQMLQAAQSATTQAREEQAWRCSAESFVAQAKAAAADANAGNVTLISTRSASTVNCSVGTAGQINGITSGTTASPSPSLPSAAGSSDALSTMMAQSWGRTAANNATALGVNPNALAATCVLESGCSANVGGTGTISGAFQMSNGTYAEGCHRLIKDRGAAVAVVDERDHERQRRHAIGVRPRSVLEAEPADLVHQCNEASLVEPAYHVAFTLVGAGAEIPTIQDADIRVDAAAPVSLEAGGTAKRGRMLCRIIPESLRLPEMMRGFVRGPAVHFTIISAVSPNRPTRCSSPVA